MGITELHILMNKYERPNIRIYEIDNEILKGSF